MTAMLPPTWSYTEPALFNSGVLPVLVEDKLVVCDGQTVLTWDVCSGQIIRRDSKPPSALKLLPAPEGVVIWCTGEPHDPADFWQARDATTSTVRWTRRWDPGPPQYPLIAGEFGTAWTLGPTSVDGESFLLQLDMATGRDVAAIPGSTVTQLAVDARGLVVARLSPGDHEAGLERIPLDGSPPQAWAAGKCSGLDVSERVVLVAEHEIREHHIRTARDSATGEVLWQVGGGTGLCRHGDTVFLGVGATIRAVDLHTGAVRWSSSTFNGRLLGIHAAVGRVWAKYLMGSGLIVLDARDGTVLEQSDELSPEILESAGATVLFDQRGLRAWVD